MYITNLHILFVKFMKLINGKYKKINCYNMFKIS